MTAVNLADEGTRARIALEIQGIIAYPDDADARRQFWCVVAATSAEGRVDLARADDPIVATTSLRLLDVWETLYRECGGRRTLLDAPSLDAVLDEHHRRFLKGLIAGWVLVTVLDSARRDPAQASVNRAKEAVRRDLPSDVAGYLGIPRSHRPIDETWSRYRCVAHLAAGLLSIGLVMLNPRAFVPQGISLVGAPNPPLALSTCWTEDELRRALRRAAAALREASSIIPRGQKHPILAWSDARSLPRWAAECEDAPTEWSPAITDLAAVMQRSMPGISSGGLRHT